MPRHLISDMHEWINEIPTVPIYYLAKPVKYHYSYSFFTYSIERRQSSRLTWVRVLKFVFANPIGVSKHMVNVPFFNQFQKAPTCEHYIDGLVKRMAGLSVSPAPAGPRVKCHLADIEDSEEEQKQVEIPINKKKVKKSISVQL